MGTAPHARAGLAARLVELWDFEDPAASRQRFRDEAAVRTDPAERAIVLTQQARATALVGDLAAAGGLLDGVEAQAGHDPEVTARVALERGRLLNAAGEPEAARGFFEEAARLTAQSRDATPLGGLHVDALHMVALTLDDPAAQAGATRVALAIAEASADPTARAWRASLLNNLGCALVDAGDPQAALPVFVQAQRLREAADDRRGSQVARWMVGWAQRLCGQVDAARATQTALAAELRADGLSDEFAQEELALLGAPGTAASDAS